MEMTTNDVIKGLNGMQRERNAKSYYQGARLMLDGKHFYMKRKNDNLAYLKQVKELRQIQGVHDYTNKPGHITIKRTKLHNPFKTSNATNSMLVKDEGYYNDMVKYLEQTDVLYDEIIQNIDIIRRYVRTLPSSVREGVYTKLFKKLMNKSEIKLMRLQIRQSQENNMPLAMKMFDSRAMPETESYLIEKVEEKCNICHLEKSNETKGWVMTAGRINGEAYRFIFCNKHTTYQIGAYYLTWSKERGLLR